MAPFDRHASSKALKSLLTGARRELLMDFENPGLNYTLIKRPGEAIRLSFGSLLGWLTNLESFG